MTRRPHTAKGHAAAGRKFGERGAARILKEAERAPSKQERIARWRVLYERIPVEAKV